MQLPKSVKETQVCQVFNVVFALDVSTFDFLSEVPEGDIINVRFRQIYNVLSVLEVSEVFL